MDGSKRNEFIRRVLDRVASAGELEFIEFWGTEKGVMTWQGLLAGARAYAGMFASVAKPGDVVFIILRHCADLYTAYFGAMLAGVVPSFLPFPNPKQDHELYWRSHKAVFGRTRPAAILTYADLVPLIQQACQGLDVHVLMPSDRDSHTPLEQFLYGNANSLALLQHSSGTTGLKKGVMLSFETIVRQVDAYAKALHINDRCGQIKIASWLPLYHDMGLIACFMLPLVLGIRLVSLDAFEWTNRPYILLDAIDATKATHVWLPNFAFNHIARTTPTSRRYNLSHIEALINCSEPCKPATFSMFQKRFEQEGIRREQLQVCYAMAETVFAVSQTQGFVEELTVDSTGIDIGEVVLSDAAPAAGRKFLSNGRPIEGAMVSIRRNTGAVTQGTLGEICVKASFLFDGYFADLAATEAAFVDGWYKTGDLGFMWNDEVYVIGRIKEIIIVNGRNFYSHEVEEVVSKIPGLKPGRAVAFGVHNPASGSEQIVVVAECENKDSEHALPKLVNAELLRHIGVAAGDVRIVDQGWLVKTTSGKISRTDNALKFVVQFRPGAEVINSQAKWRA